MNHESPDRDAGSVLPMTLAFLALGSLVVMALLSFASVLFLNRPPLEERSDSLEAVRSAMRMAITMQRSHGPDGCFDHPSGTFAINNRTVSVNCQVVTQENRIGGRFSLIATTNRGNPARGGAAIAATGTGKSILNDVFVNGGSLAGGGSISIGDAGLVGSSAASALTSSYRYGVLPPVPAIDASATPTCASYFGPQVLSFAAARPPLVPPATNWATTPQLKIDGQLVPVGTNVTVQAVASGTDILGVIVTDSTGAKRLDRSGLATNSFTLKPSPLTASITNVDVCHQTVPSTAATFVPDTRTFCGSPLMAAEQYGQLPTRPDGIDCGGQGWSKYAGWSPTAQADHVYPMLPRIPSVDRSSTPLEVGSASHCFVFYPGRYSGDLNLTAGSGTVKNQYYFASGIYLFEGAVKIQPGVRVVGGQGKWQGCTFDAEASFLPGSPKNHDITGYGVTFLLGGNGNTGAPSSGRLDIDDASVRLNERVATNSTRASAGISVMSVNLATPAPAPGTALDVEIPFNDRVLLPGCLGSEVATNPACAQDIAAYSNTPVAGATPLRYRPSLLRHDDQIIDIDLNGTVADDDRVQFGGAIFTPNAAVSFQRTAAGTGYAVEVSGGIVASTMEFDFAAGDADSVRIGQDAATVYEMVKLKTTTNFDNKEFEALVDLEIDDSARYAINSWVVGSETTGAGGGTGGGTTTTTTIPPTTTLPTTTTTLPPTTTTTTLPPTTTTTTLPPTTTTTTLPPTTTTTTLPTTTTTTTLPPSGYNFCANGSSWTTNFGPGTWTRKDWKNPNLSGPSAKTNSVSKIDVDYGSGNNTIINQSDGFSVRWSRQIEVAKACNIQLRAGGDDGYRVKIDGSLVINNWSDHAFEQTTQTVAITPGFHTVEFEFYENGGDARALFEWKK